jgi:hypothetical protein
MTTAVVPPTFTSIPSGVAAGITLFRKVCTRSVVSKDCGDVSGITVRAAAVPSGLIRGSPTNDALGVSAIRFRSSPRLAAPPPSAGSSAATRSGPFEPGPKPRLARSYASRVMLPEGLLPSSGSPSGCRAWARRANCSLLTAGMSMEALMRPLSPLRTSSPTASTTRRYARSRTADQDSSRTGETVHLACRRCRSGRRRTRGSERSG